MVTSRRLNDEGQLNLRRVTFVITMVTLRRLKNEGSINLRNYDGHFTKVKLRDLNYETSPGFPGGSFKFPRDFQGGPSKGLIRPFQGAL